MVLTVKNGKDEVFCGGDDLFRYRGPVFDLFLPSLTGHVTWQVT